MMSGNSGNKSLTLNIIAILAALLIITIVVLPFIIEVNQFRPQIEARLASALGRDVKIGTLKLSLLSSSLTVKDIEIADNADFSRSPFVTAKSLQIGIELKPLIFSKQIRITGISLDSPGITLINTSEGKWNFSDLGQKRQETAPKAKEISGNFSQTDIQIKQLRITDGQVTIIKGNKKPSIYKDVNIAVRNFSSTSSFPFTLTASLPGGGNLKMEGTAGPLSAIDTLRTHLDTSLTVNQFDLIASGFVAPDSGLSGIFNFTGKTTSNGRLVQSKGTATAEKLQIVKAGIPAGKPISMNYLVQYDLAEHTGSLRDITVGFGKAMAHLNGDFDTRSEALNLKARLNGKNMPVQDLKELLPAFGVVLPKGATLEGGILNTELTAEGPIDKMKILGTAEMVQTRLTGYDLSGKMTLLAKLAGLKSNQQTEIEKFSSGMELTAEGIQVSNLLLIMPELGTISGNGKIATNQSLDFVMQALVKPGGELGAGLMRLSKDGALKVPFFVRGTAADPRFIPDTKNAVRSLLESTFSGGSSDKQQTGKGDALGDALRGLFNKKK
jgi:AsmA protein